MKSTKLLKLLSASAIVAGSNSFALADCSICKEKEHDRNNCPNFDYKGYGASIGYYRGIIDSSDRFHLGLQAEKDPWGAKKFITAPKSTTVSFVSDDNSDRVTTVSESDATEMQAAAEETKREDAAVSEAENKRRAEVHAKRLTERRRNQDRAGVEANTRDEGLQHLFGEDNMKSMARERDTQELNNMLAERRETARNLNGLGKTLDERTRNYVDNRYGMESLEWDAGQRGAEEARSVAEENRKKINISDAEKLDIEVRNTIEEGDRQRAKRARARDGKELNEMVAASLAKNREDRREARELRAKDAHLQAHLRRREKEREQLTSMMKNSLSENREREREERLSEARDLSEKREALESAREARRREAGANELRKNNEAANKIQNAARRRLARRKAAELKDEAERQGKLQEHRENAAAKKIAEALRANKERKEAQRQAQIAGDYELAKKLQAEYDAEDRQIRADRLLAEQEQLRENLAAVPVEETQNGEDFEYRSEQDQINADGLLAQQEQAREYLEAEPVVPTHADAAESTKDSEAPETENWTVPLFAYDAFKGFDFENGRSRARADRWDLKLNDLGIRKLEVIFWLVCVEYQNLVRKYHSQNELAAVTYDVDEMTFPYGGSNGALLNVSSAFEHADTADFVRATYRLGQTEMEGILYYLGFQYMHRLIGGAKPADKMFSKLAKAAVEHFGAVWEFDEENVAAKGETSGTKVADEIVETEPQENTRWNPPYRVFYAYTHNIPYNLRPSSGSREVNRNPELYRANLRTHGIRRLEVLIYLANGIYKDGLKNGALPLTDELAKFVEDVDNVFPKAGQGEPNARIMNVYNALKNLLDKPNDNPISMQPFQKGFRALTLDEETEALGDMAVAYREMLRNGHRPAIPAFVNWANEICRALNLDGFVDGKDNVHPELTFEEFGNGTAKPQVADAANANNNPAVITVREQEPEPIPEDWEMPLDVSQSLTFRYDGYYSNPDRETENEGQAREKLQKAIREYNVRQLEALLGVTLATYTQKLEWGNHPISDRLAQRAKDIWQLILNARNSDDERLSNLGEIVRKADNKGSFQRDVENLPVRQIEAFIGMIAEIYGEKLFAGAVPADKLFKTFAGEVLELFSLGSEELIKFLNPKDEATNDAGNGANLATASDGGNPIKTGFWQMPTVAENSNEDGIRTQLSMLNIRQTEVLLAVWARACKDTYGLEERARAICNACDNLDAAPDSDRVPEFRSAMEKARGKAGFEEDMSSVSSWRARDWFKMLKEAYRQKLTTARPVTQEFASAVEM